MMIECIQFISSVKECYENNKKNNIECKVKKKLVIKNNKVFFLSLFS